MFAANGMPAAAALRQAVVDVNPEQPITAIHSMTDVIAGSAAGQSFDALLVGLFAGIALALASVGPLQTSEWSDAYAILVAVLKRRAYAAWLQEERAASLVLSPDAFNLPDPQASVSLPDWRAETASRPISRLPLLMRSAGVSIP